MDSVAYKQTQRFWERVQIGMPEECWEWQGTCRTDGYGQIYIDGKHRASHRVSFFLANRYFPPVVRHKCDNPKCVNPHHLEGGTQSDNMKDVVKRGRHFYANKTHCPWGHEYTEDNTYYRKKEGGRECRTCRRERRNRERETDLGM